jgi:FkbM family methyltransferase
MNFVGRSISRVFLWRRFISSFKGTSFIAELNLFLSAIVDILFHAISGWSYNPKTLFSGIYLVEEYDFYVFSRGRTDDLYDAIPHREGDVHDFIVNALRKGDVFVDVGANIGYYTILASKIVGDEGQVLAVEPVPQTAAMLKFNVWLNGLKNVTVIDKAAWLKHDLIKLKIPMKEFGCASTFRCGTLEVQVEAHPLDYMLTNLMDITLMKIDVEGAEYEALLGSQEVLARTKALVIELSRKAKECLSLLQEHGFKCCKAKFTTYYVCYKT